MLTHANRRQQNNELNLNCSLIRRLTLKFKAFINPFMLALVDVRQRSFNCRCSAVSHLR